MIVQNGWNEIRKAEKWSYFRAGMLTGLGATVLFIHALELLFT